MASVDQTSNTLPHPARGSDLLRPAIGKKLTGLRRYVLGLGTSNSASGHGVTELRFGHLHLVIGTGPNEDHIVIDHGPVMDLDPNFWTPIEAADTPEWSHYLNITLSSIDLYTDGFDDVAILFSFEGGYNFSLALHDTDLVMAQALEPFDDSYEEISLREHISATA